MICNKLKMYVMGHLPPPVTGENLCRREFVSFARSGGVAVTDLSRSSIAKIMLGSGDFLVIYNGVSWLGTLCDIFITFVGLLRYKRIYWCFHNLAWLRFTKIPPWFWFGLASRITVVALRNEISDKFARKGYQAVVLNNCPEACFEEISPSEPVAATKRIIWMGRLESVKGFDTALEAFRLLRSRDASWMFDVYGGSVEQAKELGLYDVDATYHGFVTDYDKVRAFALGGVFVLPSRLQENQPLSIIEALSQSIPVVACDRGGISEMLNTDRGPSGIVLNNGTAKEYSEKICDIIDDYNRYSRSAGDTYNVYFSRNRYFQEVMDLLQLSCR